jgi:hypothetical protein
MKSASWFTVGLSLILSGCCECPRCDLGDVEWDEVESVRLLRKSYCDDHDDDCESELVDDMTYDLKNAMVRFKEADVEAERSGVVPSGSPPGERVRIAVAKPDVLERVTCAFSCEGNGKKPATTNTLTIKMPGRVISMNTTHCDSGEEPDIASIEDALIDDLRSFLD